MTHAKKGDEVAQSFIPVQFPWKFSFLPCVWDWDRNLGDILYSGWRLLHCKVVEESEPSVTGARGPDRANKTPGLGQGSCSAGEKTTDLGPSRWDCRDLLNKLIEEGKIVPV